jgi:hypothetical protein
MSYFKHLDASGALIEWRDTEQFAYGAVIEGGSLVETTEAAFLAAHPEEAARRAVMREATIKRELESIDIASIRAIREAVLGDTSGQARLATLETQAGALRQTLQPVTTGSTVINPGGGVTIKVGGK